MYTWQGLHTKPNMKLHPVEPWEIELRRQAEDEEDRVEAMEYLLVLLIAVATWLSVWVFLYWMIA